MLIREPGRGLSAQLIGKLEALVQGDRRPDNVILLDMPPEIGLARARARGTLDRFEQEEQAFFERVRQGYLERAEAFPDRYVVVDAVQDVSDVQQSLEAVMTRWFADA
jgi:dTMP kinase